MQCDAHVVDPLLEDSSKEITARLLDEHAADAAFADAACEGGTIPAPRRVSLDVAAAGGRPPRRDGTAVPLLREARAILLHESRQLPLPTLVTLLSLFVWLIFTDIMKDYSPCGGVLYWALVLSVVPVVTLLMAVVRRVLIHNTVVKQQVSHAACPHNVQPHHETASGHAAVEARALVRSTHTHRHPDRSAAPIKKNGLCATASFAGLSRSVPSMHGRWLAITESVRYGGGGVLDASSPVPCRSAKPCVCGCMPYCGTGGC